MLTGPVTLQTAWSVLDWSQVKVNSDRALRLSWSGGVGWCNGDSGAPLMCGGDVLSGLSSWGYGCGQPGLPDVFTKTLYFNQWIEGNIEE